MTIGFSLPPTALIKNAHITLSLDLWTLPLQYTASYGWRSVWKCSKKLTGLVHVEDVLWGVAAKDMEQYQYLGDCAPTPPLTQHVIIS